MRDSTYKLFAFDVKKLKYDVFLVALLYRLLYF